MGKIALELCLRAMEQCTAGDKTPTIRFAKTAFEEELLNYSNDMNSIP